MTVPPDPAPYNWAPTSPVPPTPTVSPTPMPHKSRARWWVVALAVVVVAVGVLATYLWLLNAQWQAQNDELRTQTSALDAQLAVVTAENEELQVELDDAQTNLDGATGKVTALADSSANARDESAFLTELVDSFSECAKAQGNHISHLQNASKYTASSLAAEGRDVEKYCDDVAEAYSDFLDNLKSS